MPEQRRLVTILFADVTGSTALGEALDPEDVRALMGRYFAHARRVVADHGGTLEKFIGDAVMAVFGLTHAWGDDPERALSAALALRDAIAEDSVLARWLTLRMGVNTGEVRSDVRALMGRYFAHARRVVADHGGTLEKFIGDAVMAVFGLTHAWGDDPERALSAALALRDAIAEDSVLARWLTLRMGVNTGEV